MKKNYLSAILGAFILNVSVALPIFAKDVNYFGKKKDASGTVMVSITPKEFKNGILSFSMRVNTHSVNDLNKYDLKKIISLETGGKSLTPETTPSLSGHHSGGELKFKVKTAPEKIKIVIKGLHDKENKIFEW